MKKSRFAVLAAALLVLSACGAGERESVPDTGGGQSGAGMTEMIRSGTLADISGEEEESSGYAQPEMAGEITVAVMSESEFLTAAANAFMEKYPDITVTIHTYQGTGGENALEEYRTGLNTRIMSRTAEDIIFTTQIPLEKYMDMGVFADLSDFLAAAPEMNEGNYFMNVLESARDENGRLYVMPYMAFFQTISFAGDLSDRNLLEPVGDRVRYSEAFRLAKEMVDTGGTGNVYLSRESGMAHMDQLITEYQGTLIDRRAGEVRIDPGTYIAWLEEIKDLMGRGYFLTGGTVNYYDTDYHFAMIRDYDVQAAFYLIGESSYETGVPVADEKGDVYTSASHCFGINSASEHPELAWEFLRYLLSPEIQCLPSLHGLAVNREGFAASAKRYFTFYADGTEQAVDWEEYRDLLERWMSRVSKCDTLDPAILAFFDEENKKFFDGLQTAEQTVQAIQNKVTQYLNE